jgi:O-antigen/teichoic acid export membrane protein
MSGAGRGPSSSPPGARQTVKRVVRGGWVLSSAFVVVGLSNYFYSLLLTRLLAPELFADFAAAQGVLLVCGTVATASIPWVIARVFATTTGRAERRAVVWFGLVGNLGQGLVAAAVVLLITGRFLSLPEAAWPAAAAFSIFLVTTPVGVFQGEQRVWAVGALRIAEALVKIVVGWVLVSHGAGVAGALGGAAVGAAAVAAVGLLLVRRHLHPSRAALQLRPLWRSSLGIGSVQALVAVLASLDVVWVGVLPFGRVEAGSYQAAAILGRIPVFLASALAVASYPAIARKGAQSARVMATALGSYAVLAGCFLVVLLTVPGPLVGLVFPADYSAVRTFLPYAAVTGVAAGAVGLLTTWFQGTGRFQQSLRRQAAGLAVAVAALPTGAAIAGLLGVAIAATVGPVITAALLLLAAGDARPSLAPSLRDAVTLALLGVGAWVARPWPLAWWAVMAVLTAMALWRLASIAK